MRAYGVPLHPRLLVSVLAAVMALLPVSGEAEIYVWKTKDGVLHFSDQAIHKGYRPFVQDPAPAQPVRVSDGYFWSRSEIRNEIRRLAIRHGLDPELVEAVVTVESDFDPFAVSEVGAMGLMQLMPETARLLGVREPFDPAQNLDGGIRYLRYLQDRFGGRIDWALAAYHAGENRVERFQGVPPIPATQKYVEMVINLYVKGFTREN